VQWSHNTKENLLKYKDTLLFLKTFYSISKNALTLFGIDITTIDQRFGQIDATIEKIDSIFSKEEVNKETYKIEYIENMKIVLNFIKNYLRIGKKKVSIKKMNPKVAISYFLYYSIANEVLDNFTV